MIRLFPIIIFCFLFLSPADAVDNKQPGKKVQKEVARIFDIDEPVFYTIPWNTNDYASGELIMPGDILTGVHGPEGDVGYVFSTRAKGRYDYFDYSVIFSPDLAVESIMVTTYRSSHGAGICNRGWLKQFKGYKGEEIRLGKEIDAVSGATISATSMVEDIQRCCLILKTSVSRF